MDIFRLKNLQRTPPHIWPCLLYHKYEFFLLIQIIHIGNKLFQHVSRQERWKNVKKDLFCIKNSLISSPFNLIFTHVSSCVFYIIFAVLQSCFFLNSRIFLKQENVKFFLLGKKSFRYIKN